MKHILIAALSMFVTTAAVAQPVGETATALQSAFEAWAGDHNIPNSDIVILHHGKVVGPSRNDEPVEIASLSKAITAVCVATLIDDGVWTAQTTSAEVLGFGHEGVTVAQLVTHSGGISPDSTQGVMWLWMTSNVSRKRLATEIALNRKQDVIGRYSYNNENYGILGEMIEATLDQPYEEACQSRALAPANVTTAKPSELTGGMLPWGGWSMSAQDYAQFHYHRFGPQGVYGAGSPSELLFDVGGGAQYGLGMFERDVADHRNFWHFGLWCVPGRLNTGAYAVIWQGEWSVVATYDACVDWDAMVALDGALAKVVYGL
jgi:CubicO group peptidase (beta-lactamase class C family)